MLSSSVNYVNQENFLLVPMELTRLVSALLVAAVNDDPKKMRKQLHMLEVRYKPL